jgi:lantibiotic modifying enzyme
MLAVHAELGLPGAADLATRCAERTAEFVASAPEDALPAGFAHGWAGLAAALALHTGHDKAAALALDRAGAGEPVGPGWCRGTAGLIVAGVEPEDAAGLLADRPLLRDLSLCHGELGVAEALTVLAGRAPEVLPARRAHTALILGAIEAHGPSCGTPGWVATPGLMSGLAGIGYGLLRAGFPERVPAVQLLQSTLGADRAEE